MAKGYMEGYPRIGYWNIEGAEWKKFDLEKREYYFEIKKKVITIGYYANGYRYWPSYALTKGEAVIIVAIRHGYFHFVPLYSLLMGRASLNTLTKWHKSYYRLPRARKEEILLT